MSYTLREFSIPDHMMGAIRRYIDERIHPGDFLTAVISNDLREAVGCADDTNIRALPAYVAYFYNEAPSRCWGSPEKMRAWLEGDKILDCECNGGWSDEELGGGVCRSCGGQIVTSGG
jgi:hypothetical protein